MIKNSKLQNIVSQSIFGSIGHIGSKVDLDNFIEYAKYNSDFLNSFPQLIFSFNGDGSLIKECNRISSFIDSPIEVSVAQNLGHTFGTFLLDYNVFELAKKYSYKYLWKFSNDVIVNKDIFETQITSDIDFYYTNNIGFNEFRFQTPEELLKNIVDQNYYYPQTNHYIIKNSATFHPPKEMILQLKQEFDSIRKEKPDIAPWHAIRGCDCESMLMQTVEKNNFSKQYLLPKKDTELLINFIQTNQIHDGSHKNIMFSSLGNLCHLQFPNHPVYVI